MNKNLLNNPVLQADMKEIHERGNGWPAFENCTVLITGAYGMLASYLTDYFIWLNEEKKRNVTIIASVRNKEKANARFGEHVDKDYFNLYLNSLNEPFQWQGKVDYIFHAAGIANPKLYGSIPVEVAEANALGTYNLLKWASSHPVKSFLFFSTGDVYGKIVKDQITEKDMGILDPLDLHSCYGESKRMGETWCMTFWKQYHIPTKMARIGHTYSPLVDMDNDPRVFSAFVKNALNGEDITILSDGTAKRPFCYITDAVVAFLLILLEGGNGEAYNMSNTEEFHSIAELAEIIVRASGRDIGVQILGKREDGYLENKSNQMNKPVETKLQELGWNHMITAYEGFSRVFQFLQSK